MRAILGWLLPAVMLPLTAYAQEATVKEIHDALEASVKRQLMSDVPYRQHAAGT